VPIPLLHERRTKFVERNAFLFALLGAVSVGRRFERFIATLTHETESEPRLETLPSRNVYVLLGALSLWRSVRTELEGWRPKRRRAERRHRAVPPLSSPRVVLR
jgi:hypothetical protein